LRVLFKKLKFALFNTIYFTAVNAFPWSLNLSFWLFYECFLGFYNIIWLSFNDGLRLIHCSSWFSTFAIAEKCLSGLLVGKELLWPASENCF